MSTPILMHQGIEVTYNNTKERINEIDLLRFVAALAVLLFHYSFRGHAYDDLSLISYPWIVPVAKYGYLGVQLFFMISGFVIFMTAANSSLKSFAISRIVRLYPAFWACCTLTFVAILVMGGSRFSATVTQYIANMTMLSEFMNVPSIDGAYWSIFIEIRFYLLIAILLAFKQMRNAEYFMIAWLAYAAKVAVFGADKLSIYLISEYATFFIAGASLFMVWKNGFSIIRHATIAGSFALAIYQSLKQASILTPVFKQDVSPMIVASIITVFFILMLLSATKKTGVIGRMNWAAVGALTYPLYLLHQFIGYMTFNSLYDKVNVHLLFWGVISGMLVMAYAVNQLVEKPLSAKLRGILKTDARPLQTKAD
ncbi:acyltransferase [Pseudomonas sp. HMWF021]|uniref:acyltransferase family protein n=1 Tax=Pseudomonas sp. HMWF021 TaxID=2056857 RepID=UPI001304E230|nr:acyltransferase [Pseudomonas sp. HMWF021]